LRKEPFGPSEGKPHEQTFSSNAEQSKMLKSKLKIRRDFVGQKALHIYERQGRRAGEKF